MDDKSACCCNGRRLGLGARVSGPPGWRLTRWPSRLTGFVSRTSVRLTHLWFGLSDAAALSIAPRKWRLTIARSSPQSAQRYPLTRILGTEANVRLLRELSRHGGQLSAPSLVARTGLAKTSVWAGLASLAAMGILSVAGTGRARLYSIRADNALRVPLDALFDAEETRFQDILAAIRNAARTCGQELAAVWLYGSVARGEDRPGSDLDLIVVGGAETALPAALDAVRGALHAAGDRGCRAAGQGAGSVVGRAGAGRAGAVRAPAGQARPPSPRAGEKTSGSVTRNGAARSVGNEFAEGRLRLAQDAHRQSVYCLSSAGPPAMALSLG